MIATRTNMRYGVGSEKNGCWATQYSSFAKIASISVGSIAPKLIGSSMGYNKITWQVTIDAC